MENFAFRLGDDGQLVADGEGVYGIAYSDVTLDKLEPISSSVIQSVIKNVKRVVDQQGVDTFTLSVAINNFTKKETE